MKIGYPCINTSIGCTANKTFRLSSYSRQNMVSKIENNLSCLKKILGYNSKNNLLFFRIGSGIIPFASHTVCDFKWQDHFKKDFASIGNYIKKQDMRISMHPDQFVLINAKNSEIIKRSVKELEYQSRVLDLMKLKEKAKIQIHVGGVYKDKEKSIQRFIENCKKLTGDVKKRLVIENDDRSYNLRDCLKIHKKIKIPVVFDSFHHECLNAGESLKDAITSAAKTWGKKDGCLMIDYSSQEPMKRKGTHAKTINPELFKKFVKQAKTTDCDIMLEIKDKEKSALKAASLII
ncbi:UV damage repair endonuclease UvsE [Candidatus Altiarchaeales archaeon WOR_SM1_SCG]|nr:UV damage repair endonuclease UvsE [Candidatus Altiarchaeales archaeon WOR_SM1_SCG]